jgi:mono/diheme cytochrome c family protein
MHLGLRGMIRAGLVLAFTAAPAFFAAAQSQDPSLIARGRYLVVVGGCNDCHTPGFAEKNGAVPETEWLTGSPVGWHGPWGTTYPANLRLLLSKMTEGQWFARINQPFRPPMPGWALRAMTDEDKRAVYAFIRSLGPKGEPVPAFVPPGGKIRTPFMDLTVQNLPKENAGK